MTGRRRRWLSQPGTETGSPHKDGRARGRHLGSPCPTREGLAMPDDAVEILLVEDNPADVELTLRADEA